MKAVEAAKAVCGASLKYMYFSVGESLGLLSQFGLHNRMGIPRDRPLYKYLSVGTVIIIDQLDMNILLDKIDAATLVHQFNFQLLNRTLMRNKV